MPCSSFVSEDCRRVLTIMMCGSSYYCLHPTDSTETWWDTHHRTHSNDTLMYSDRRADLNDTWMRKRHRTDSNGTLKGGHRRAKWDDTSKGSRHRAGLNGTSTDNNRHPRDSSEFCCNARHLQALNDCNEMKNHRHNSCNRSLVLSVGHEHLDLNRIAGAFHSQDLRHDVVDADRKRPHSGTDCIYSLDKNPVGREVLSMFR